MAFDKFPEINCKKQHSGNPNAAELFVNDSALLDGFVQLLSAGRLLIRELFEEGIYEQRSNRRERGHSGQ